MSRARQKARTHHVPACKSERHRRERPVQAAKAMEVSMQRTPHPSHRQQADCDHQDKAKVARMHIGRGSPFEVFNGDLVGQHHAERVDEHGPKHQKAEGDMETQGMNAVSGSACRSEPATQDQQCESGKTQAIQAIPRQIAARDRRNAKCRNKHQ